MIPAYEYLQRDCIHIPLTQEVERRAAKFISSDKESSYTLMFTPPLPALLKSLFLYPLMSAFTLFTRSPELAVCLAIKCLTLLPLPPQSEIIHR